MASYSNKSRIIFLKLIVLSRPHRIGTVGTGQRHRNVCYQRCSGYLACIVRGIEQRCDDLGSQENHVSAGHQILLPGRNNHGFVYPSELFSDRRYSDSNHIFLPHQSGLADIQSNTTSSHDQQKESNNRHISEQRLYNSRIGQALTHTLRNKIGRNRGQQNSRNFTSLGWQNSRVRSSDNEQRNTNLQQTTVKIAQTTPSIVNINVSQDNASSCTVCDGNSDCSDGNYCYYSPTCARRTCQPL